MLKVARSLRKLMLFIWGGLGGAQISQNTASGVKVWDFETNNCINWIHQPKNNEHHHL
ncbi:hypothetical protein RHMOL_Rhmol11G0006300 [Rhododendron molle]|uniref:Uncharacterized protein n=1 Tax=Rhododendron molle TaxID=49168 RepID=A0ACC0LND1_RHOML|nr:hypothetical protein RHMOL_Rhmol11G0006300 [Rhododendron molle]